jgi:hypothetical protein
MATVQVTLNGSAQPAIVNLDKPTGQVVITMQANPAETYVTINGVYPVIPGASVVQDQKTLPGNLGQWITIAPPILGGQPQLAQVRLLSAGTPTVTVEW